MRIIHQTKEHKVIQFGENVFSVDCKTPTVYYTTFKFGNPGLTDDCLIAILIARIGHEALSRRVRDNAFDQLVEESFYDQSLGVEHQHPHCDGQPN